MPSAILHLTGSKMEARTSRKRISAPERRLSILTAARKLFAERGFDGTKTSQIAAAAGVSEALLYRHFASKEVLYRAVLRQMVRDQNQMYDILGVPEPSTASLVLVIREFLKSCVGTEPGTLREGLRIMLASLAGDGSYAGLVYRRAMRVQLTPVEQALAAARNAGDIEGPGLAPENVAMFIEHVGTMVAAGKSLPRTLSPYSEDVDRLLDDVTWFCCRGIGLKTTAVERYLADASGTVPKLTGIRPAKRSLSN